MSQFEDWQNRSGKYGAKIWGDMTREPKTSAVDSGLRKAVAYYLYIQSKDVPDEFFICTTLPRRLFLTRHKSKRPIAGLASAT